MPTLTITSEDTGLLERISKPIVDLMITEADIGKQAASRACSFSEAVPRDTIAAEAFDRGQPVRIAMVNKATTPLDVDIHALCNAYQQQVDQHFFPVWGISCRLAVMSYVPAGWWGLGFLDDADAANALGYHDLTPGGQPLGKIFVRTTKNANKKVSVTGSHELLEMLADPGINLGAIPGPNAQADLYAYEVCDACEDSTYQINGIDVSDFVFPSYFEGFRPANSDKFDYLGLITQPFQILPGGYMPVMVNGRWSQIFGSTEAKAAFDITARTRCPRRTRTV